MKQFIFFTALLFSVCAHAQTTISGKVTDHKGIPIPGANVFLVGTYDGTSTDIDGNFSFSTSEEGSQTLSISFMAFETYELKEDVRQMNQLEVKLKEAINTLTGVTLTAGTFEAGDNAKVTALNTLDIVTTAGAVGDVVGALQTLPGTSTVAEDGRLFVRGGEADETQIFIDGIRVFTPYNTSPNNSPTRGRYSPFLFSGTSFSTGGYSAEYGEALSSVLLLNTINEPEEEATDISIMSIGAGLGNTQIWGENSLSVNLSYMNLAPYLELFPDRNEWEKPFQVASGEAVYRHKLDNGLFKFYSAFDYTNFAVNQRNINYEDRVKYDITNKNWYSNFSYKGALKNDWILSTGASLSLSKNDMMIIDDAIDQTETAYHLKMNLKKKFNSHIKLNTGIEYFSSNYEQDFQDENNFQFTSEVQKELPVIFAETDIFFTNKLALKAGLRTSYDGVSDKILVSPRTSLAYKTGKNDQVSFAYGNFYQTAANSYLQYAENLKPQQAQHYILNYQYTFDGRIFRAETYYKKYDDLVKFDGLYPEYGSDFSNNGAGYATGLDVFWRDEKTFKNVDYWVSYSYLDTKRDFRNYEAEVMPNFAANHNFSLVTKYWINDLKSQFGFTYSFTSGRPYDDRNTTEFMNAKTKSYNNIGLNWAYLVSQQQILFVSVTNPLGFKNISGYQYADAPNSNGFYDRQAVRPNADSFVFVGFFWTISSNKNRNQLDNL
ncbi:Outer membrane cobalamin receptor protein [Pustulibacterium marinum]|uniref:Outer membrane cobalamin receptor protein n=1 Tax=Pustulibacterium marinum TaxID=1224947 RepID=A0A1I7HWN3_9FLAO|nr:TonB-dependent receptor [Pustulibacterium marinum]SFU64906.1 Outer membrane cobalamin receptor protein [Pustulibacterium marinum]